MTMRDIHVSAITDAVKKLCMDANTVLEPDMLRAFDRAVLADRGFLATILPVGDGLLIATVRA